MSLFDRLLEQQLKPKPTTFEQKREQWLQDAHARARGELPPAALRVAIEVRNAEVNAPLPSPPRPAPGPPPEPVNLKGPLMPVGSCKAVNPATGIQCALLKGHTKNHRHGSTEFQFGAAPGQTSFSRRARLDELASSRSASPFTTPQGD